MSTQSTLTQRYDFTHLWEIPNFYYLMGSAFFKSLIQSLPFSAPPNVAQQLPDTVREAEYEMILYPGDGESNFMSIYLKIPAEVQEYARVIFQFSIIDANGAARFIARIDSPSQNGNGITLGVRRWVPHGDLLDPANVDIIFPGGTLTMCLDMGIIISHESDVKTEKPLKVDKFVEAGQKELYNSLSDLWKRRNEYSDLVLKVSLGNVAVPAHKAILVARSPVFAAIFQNEQTIESRDNRICIPDMSAEVCEAFVKYLYTSVVESLETLAGELLPFADKYQINHLKSICEETLCAQISFENANRLMNLAEIHNATKLKERLANFLDKKRQLESISTDFDPETPDKISKRRYSY